LLAFAAAALVFLLQVRVIALDLLDQRIASTTPAVLSATTTQIKDGLANNLGLACAFDGLVKGAYESWLCKAPSGAPPSLVYLYSRKLASDRSDYLSASTDDSDAPAFFAGVLRMLSRKSMARCCKIGSPALPLL